MEAVYNLRDAASLTTQQEASPPHEVCGTKRKACCLIPVSPIIARRLGKQRSGWLRNRLKQGLNFWKGGGGRGGEGVEPTPTLWEALAEPIFLPAWLLDKRGSFKIYFFDICIAVLT